MDPNIQAGTYKDIPFFPFMGCPEARSDFCSADPQQASAKTAAWMPFKLKAIPFEGYTLNYTNLLRVASNLSDVYFLFPFKLLP